ncbi:MAG: CHAT domain-containing protein [bacterium]
MLKWIENIFNLESGQLEQVDPGELNSLLREKQPENWDKISLPDEIEVTAETRKLVHSFLDSIISIASAKFLDDFFQNILSRENLALPDRQKFLIKYGMFLATTHKFSESLVQFEAALELSKNPEAVESSDQVMNYLGVVYYRMGELQKALESHEKSLEILAISENEESKAIYYNNLGIVQKEIGLTREAAESFKKAMPIMRKLDRPEFLAVLYMNIGSVYYKLGRYEDALNFQKEALKLHRETGRKFEECSALTNIGNALKDMEEYAEAARTMHEALKLAEENDFKLQQAVNLYNLGLLHKQIGEADEAENNFRKSANISEQINDKEGIWRACLEIGDLKRESSEFDDSFHFLKRAEKVFESMRKDLKADRDRVAFLSNQKELLEKIVFLELEKNSDNFWGIVQDAKSRSLRELLLVNSNGENGGEDNWSEQRAHELWKTEKLGAGDCLVDFFVGQDALIRFVYHPDFGLKQSVKKIPRKKITEEIDRIHEEIKLLESMGPNLEDEGYAISTESEWLKPFENLYFLLFSDITDQLKPFDQLIINPHGALHRLPFAALQGKNGSLVQNHAVVLSPSLPLLAWQLDRPVSFDDGLKLFITSPDELAMLTKEEGRQLKKIAGDGILLELGDNLNVQLPSTFTGDTKLVLALDQKENFKENLSAVFGELSLFHFAGHGIFNSSDPMQSYLKISPEMKITSEEFYRGDFHSNKMKLIALSACETGKLQVSGGDEIWGFARALFGSGARSLLLSMWKVEDQSGHDLMLDFYHNLFHDGLPLGRSLGHAQRRILERMNNPHPFFWAPFQLYGSP